MVFSATLSEKAASICKKFMKNKITEILIDDQQKLTLHGLTQYYCEVREEQKNKILINLLQKLNFNQVIIFVSKVNRAKTLNKLLTSLEFVSCVIHSEMS